MSFEPKLAPKQSRNEYFKILENYSFANLPLSCGNELFEDLNIRKRVQIKFVFFVSELKHLTSTPAGKIRPNAHLRSKVKAEFPEGRFFGYGRHRDGAEISKNKILISF